MFYIYISFVDNTNHVPQDVPSRTDALLTNIYITEQDIKDILQTLKIGQACGDNGITHQMLKSTSETICIPLTIIFNFSLHQHGKLRELCQLLKKTTKVALQIIDQYHY